MERILLILILSAFPATQAGNSSGSTSTFYYTILGTGGKTAEYKTDDDENNREKGQRNTYKIRDDTDIGELRCVSIRIEGGDGWGIAEISVEVDRISTSALNRGLGWIDNDPVEMTEIAFCITDFIDKTENRCPETHPFSFLQNNWCCSDSSEKTISESTSYCDGGDLGDDSICCAGSTVKCPNLPCFDNRTVEYKVTITTVTSTEFSYSGTNGNFYCTILGTEGETAEYNMNNPGTDMEIGQTDIYTVRDSTDIGEFRCVSIRAAGTDGWSFSEISVEVDGISLPVLYKGVGLIDDNPVELIERAFCITDFIDKTDNRCPKPLKAIPFLFSRITGAVLKMRRVPPQKNISKLYATEGT
ncbi:hypothetical protein ACHWQZ_G017848 [Mnemiopsis leidyi]